ncbi:hypothetical protein [Ensifer sp. MJa1]|uniref:hypothetical protein n=1 Tax=Ensifer sp. MJa1 TaxID=2919888 RepID=UPI00300BEC72
MTEEKGQPDPAPDLVAHYRPVQLKAVLAACAVKYRLPEPPSREEWSYGTPLPEGFHLPQSVHDD